MMRYAFPQSRASATNNGLLGLTAPPLFENPHNLSLAGSRGRAIQVRAADEFAQTVLPVIRAIQAAETTSFASIADVLNERAIKSAQGGKWHVSSVANVLSRTPG